METGKSEFEHADGRQTILFPYAPDRYWEKMRLLLREEFLKKEKTPVSELSNDTAGLTYKPLFRIDEVCIMFSVSRQTIYQWIQEGLLKPHKVRSRVYFLKKDLDLLIGK